MSPADASHPFDLFLESIDLRFREGDDDVESKRAEQQAMAAVQQMYADITDDLRRSPRPQVELPSLLKWLAEDVLYEWFSPVMPPFAGTQRGREDVYAQILRNFAALEDQQPVMQRIVAQGRDVAVVIHETGRLVDTGKQYELDGVQIFTLEDGLVTRFQTYGHLTEFDR